MAEKPPRATARGFESLILREMAFAYALYSPEHDRYYIGSTRDLEKRLKAHHNGKVRSTKTYRPWKLVYSEHFETYTEARKREIFLKTGAGRKWIKEDIKKYV